ncbi:MAG: carbohydrate kinase family protein [Clostridia bacterium]|nr:carbohydrate kinase family protein [Clostridia bacterium]
MKNGIVVIGTVLIDIKGYPISRYIPGGRNAGRVDMMHGGVSRNVVEDIANVELRPTFISTVDDDGTGHDVVERLRQHRVNTGYMRFVPGGTGAWLAVFDNSGDVVASISRRPDTSGIGRILEEQGDEIIRDCDAVAVEVDIEEDILKRVFYLAEKYGRRVFALVSNMTIALERRDLLRRVSCLVCNEQEAGLFFSEDYSDLSPANLLEILKERIQNGEVPQMVVTMGGQGAVYASLAGECGMVPAQKVDVVDTTGCGDAFFAGVCVGLTYGKNLGEACTIGTRLASSVIVTRENVCPRFLPAEFGLPEIGPR